MAFLSIVTNGAQLAFTSNIVTKESFIFDDDLMSLLAYQSPSLKTFLKMLYYFDNGSMEGFVNYLYSRQISDTQVQSAHYSRSCPSGTRSDPLIPTEIVFTISWLEFFKNSNQSKIRKPSSL